MITWNLGLPNCAICISQSVSRKEERLRETRRRQLGPNPPNDNCAILLSEDSVSKAYKGKITLRWLKLNGPQRVLVRVSTEIW